MVVDWKACLGFGRDGEHTTLSSVPAHPKRRCTPVGAVCGRSLLPLVGAANASATATRDFCPGGTRPGRAVDAVSRTSGAYLPQLRECTRRAQVQALLPLRLLRLLLRLLLRPERAARGDEGRRQRLGRALLGLGREDGIHESAEEKGKG